MGRVQLSTAFGIDGPRRTTGLKYPQPPLYTDAPFDFDSDVDAPDAVYEAFLTPEEVEARNANSSVVGGNITIIPVPRNDVVPSAYSDDSSSASATTPTLMRGSPVPTIIHVDSASPSPRSASPVGGSVLQLMEPLTIARANAMPAVNAVLAGAADADVNPLVNRIHSIIRPRIASAIGPFVQDIPEVEYFGHMFERSLILELLVGRFSRTDVLSALDSAEEASLSPAPDVEVVQAAASDSDSDFSLDDDSEDLGMSDVGTDSRSPSPGSWSGRSAQSVPIIQPLNTTDAVPGTLAVDPALVPTPPSARPLVIDVDTDDDAHSTSSSSAAASVVSAPRYSMQSGISNFTPRVFRARDAIIRPQVILDERPGTNFHPVHHQRVLAPMR